MTPAEVDYAATLLAQWRLLAKVTQAVGDLPKYEPASIAFIADVDSNGDGTIVGGTMLISQLLALQLCAEIRSDLKQRLNDLNVDPEAV